MPVYKFTNEVEDKVQTKTKKVHKIHPVLKDKSPHNDNDTLSLVKSLDKNIQEDNVETKKLESTEEIYEVYSSVTDDLSHDNEAQSPLMQSIDKTLPEMDAINVDNVSPSYEVIDGTTFYFDSKPSIEQKFATEAMHAPTLPNEQSLLLTNTKTNPDNNDKTFINKKEIQHDENIVNNKPEGIESSVDIPEQTNTKTLLEDSETIINPTVDTVSKDNALLHDASSKFKGKLSKDLENEEKSIDRSAEEYIKYTKEELTENVENEGIFASFARKFNILSDSLETVTTESTNSQSINDMSASDVTIESKTIVEENIPADETLLSIDPSIISQNDIEIQQEIIHENIQSTRHLNEEIKSEEEAVVHSENTASCDVPLSSNFVHEDAYKPAQDLPIASSVLVNNSFASKEATINSHTEYIKMQEVIKEEKVIENIETEGVIASFVEESTMSPDVQKITVTKSIVTQSNDDIEQTLPDSAKVYLENAKKNVHKETNTQVSEAVVNEISDTSNLPSVEDMPENIAKEMVPDSLNVRERTEMIDDSLNDNVADIQLNATSIVHSNVNKHDNLVYDASSDNVPIESNESSNSVKSNIVDSERSADSSQNNMISEGKWVFDKYRNLADIKEDIEHKNGGY